MKNLFHSIGWLSLALIAGCSSYDKRYAEAARTPVKAGQFAGAYSGRWTSAKNSAWGDRLRCILTPVGASDYRADFKANWHGFSSEHTVVLHTKPAARKSGAAEFEGTSKLLTFIGAGTYSCKGTVDGRTLHADYDATYDRGTFALTRFTSKNEANHAGH